MGSKSNNYNKAYRRDRRGGAYSALSRRRRSAERMS